MLLGAGLVTGARILMKPDLRKAVSEALLRRLPLDEILDDLDLDLERDFGLEPGGAPERATNGEDEAERDAPEMNAAAR